MTKQLRTRKFYAHDNIVALLEELVPQMPYGQAIPFRAAITLKRVSDKRITLPVDAMESFMALESVKQMFDMGMLEVSTNKQELYLTDRLIVTMNSARVSDYATPLDVIQRAHKGYLTDFRTRYAAYLVEHFKYLGVQNVQVFCNKLASTIYITQGPHPKNIREMAKIALDAALTSNGTMSIMEKPHKHIVLKLNYSAEMDRLVYAYDNLESINGIAPLLKKLGED